MKIQKIEVEVPVDIEFPNGFDRTLDSLIYTVCAKYQRENPDRVMWPSSQGQKPIWNEPEEPTFDDAVYYIEVSEREDLYGNNPYNPQQTKLREQLRAQRE